MAKTVTRTQLDTWRDQEREEMLAWHRANGITDAELLRVYEAGFNVGWTKAVSSIDLHTRPNPVSLRKS